ncbi:MAG: restriction endonuclease [Methylobacter sp.]
MGIIQKIIGRIKNTRKTKNQPNGAVAEKRADSRQKTAHLKNKGSIKWDATFLRSLEWKRYEEVCMAYLKIKNCNTDITDIGADGGIDIKIADKNGKILAIGQCKAWSKPIGVYLIREFYGVMASEQIRHGIFLTTSTYSRAAIEFAKNKSLLLINGDEFIRLINGLNEENKRKIDEIATEGDYSTPTCVNCDVKMVKRKATKGRNEGAEFWGCVNYPKCKRTMSVKI